MFKRLICGSSKLNIFNVLDNKHEESLKDPFDHYNMKYNEPAIDVFLNNSFISLISELSNRINKNCMNKEWLNDENISYSPSNKSCFCNQITKIINQTEFGKIAYQQHSSILFGKILYVPNTPIYERVIKRMNHTFEIITNFTQSLKNFNSYLPSNDTIDKIKDYIEIFNHYREQLNSTIQPIDINFDDIQEFVAVLKKFGNFFENLFNCFELNRFIGYSSESEALEAASELMDKKKLWAVIIFNNESINSPFDLPNKITYTIRMNPDEMHSTFFQQYKAYRYEPNNCLLCNDEFLHGYIYIQDMLERSIIEVKTNETYDYAVTTQMTPYPCRNKDLFSRPMSNSLNFFMIIAWLFNVSMIVKDIVYEKEKRLKEFMRVMGLSNGIHWLVWFVTSFVAMMSISIVLALLLKYGQITPYTDLSVLLVFLCCFIIATITKCFLISVFFNQSNLAAAAGGKSFH